LIGGLTTKFKLLVKFLLEIVVLGLVVLEIVVLGLVVVDVIVVLELVAA
jgi:hypothetical protein